MDSIPQYCCFKKFNIYSLVHKLGFALSYFIFPNFIWAFKEEIK